MRALRTRTGLSLAALAERTPYSKSSWERYLNGKQLAPRQAVEALCTMAGEPPGRLLALWELADLEWSGRHSTSAAAPPHDDRPDSRGTSTYRAEPGPANGWSTGRRTWALAAGACAVGLAAAVWATVLPSTGAKSTTGQIAPSTPPAPGCRNQGCLGKNPEMMGCAMPGRVKDLGSQHRTSTGAQLAFKYSAQCRATWALMWNTHVGDVLELSVPGSRPQRVEVTDSYDAAGSLFTPMIDDGDLAGLKACFEPVGHGHTECFSR